MKSIKQILYPEKTKTDSPIEEILYQEFLKYGLEASTQYQVGVFYIDLAFPEIKLAIEADGHDYHSTKEQITRDKYREDRIKSDGWVFERFTGREIHRSHEMIAGKIALKYFKNKLNKKQEDRAIGRVIHHFMKKDMRFALQLLEAYQCGYAYKK